MNKTAKIYIAGHTGLAGSAILRLFKKSGYTNMILKTHEELDLLDQKKTFEFFMKEKPEYVFVAAAKVGGIMANKTYPGTFIYENLQIECNIIEGARKFGVKKLLFLGSSCIYPRFAKQPIIESALLSGELEPTNQAYGVGKIGGIILCQSYNEQYGTNFISVMPTNLYGPNDNFDPQNSHVVAAFFNKFHKAKVDNIPEITLWGTGKPKREFLHSDDLADACLFLMKNYDSNEIINIGTGKDVTIKELTSEISKIIGFKGKIIWDKDKPDGSPRKLLNVSKIHKLGWKHKISLNKGLGDTYEWYKKYVK
ncbi:MAG: GDP-L-fucose synthase [Patescibacteria group bacterium]